jgi:hypothetical protein
MPVRGWTVVPAALATLLVSTGLLRAQQRPESRPHQGQGLDQRGAMVMGFDQQKTAHHFYLYEDGGAIDVSVKDPADATSRDAIRTHLSHVAGLFRRGDFRDPMMVHDRADVPGTAEMSRLKTRITYAYRETPQGGRVEIVTTNPTALKAVHEFLVFQISDHKTGDSLAVRKR